MATGIGDVEQDLTGKTVLITGGNAGIGRATAEDLARRNARLLICCRDVEKGGRVAKEIVAATGVADDQIQVRHLDLCSFESVRKCAQEILRTENQLHVLINNAGVMGVEREQTEDGYDKVMQSNHLGHFLLTLLLLDLLKKSRPSRIINVSSELYRFAALDPRELQDPKDVSAFILYCNSKLANIQFTRELASRLAGTGVSVNAVHPGIVKTDLLGGAHSFMSCLSRTAQAIVGKTVKEGAQTTIYLAVNPDIADITGKYFSDCKERKLTKIARDDSHSKQIFEISEQIVGESMISSPIE